MTNPLGKNSKQLSINVHKDFHAQILALAKRSGMGIGEYCRAILNQAVKKDITATADYQLKGGELSSTGSGVTQKKVMTAVKTDLSKKVGR